MALVPACRAKRATRKAAGGGRTWKVRSRLRTPRGATLQPAEGAVCREVGHHYQLAFVMPGISPLWAISRKHKRQSPNLL
jgi:hypothetical protein